MTFSGEMEQENYERTVYANIPALFQPSYEHLKTVVCKLVSQSSGLFVVVTEIRRSVIFLDAAPGIPVDKIPKIHHCG